MVKPKKTQSDFDTIEFDPDEDDPQREPFTSATVFSRGLIARSNVD